MQMRSLINIDAPNLVVICMDGTADTDFQGRCYHRFSAAPMAFSSTMELLKALESFYDEIGFPRATLMCRSFTQDPAPGTAAEDQTKKIVQEAEHILEQKGDLATFVVHVQHRQNATWQGKIVWLNRKEEQYFRSTLEMLRLMDQAVGESNAEKTENCI